MATVCPICKRRFEPPPEEQGDRRAAGPSSFPFCSERCKLIDLGRWLDGQYQIPVAEDDLDEGSGE
ncbi:MAG TPA: DNA gyrase inhibitor YacG [Tepidisphaeraceae bacterium]